MILQKATALLEHPAATPSGIFFVCGVVTGTAFSGNVGTMGANFVYIVHNRWWVLILALLVWVVGSIYFKLESFKIGQTIVLEHQTMNELRECAEREVAAEWDRVRNQNQSCQDLHRVLSVDQRALIEERRMLRKERFAYLKYTEETAEKLLKKSKSLVGKLAEKDPSKAKRFEAENNRLMAHLKEAPERTKPTGLRPPIVKRQ